MEFMKKLLPLISLLLVTSAWAEDINTAQDLNLEGKWIATYVPISYEEIVDVLNKGMNT